MRPVLTAFKFGFTLSAAALAVLALSSTSALKACRHPIFSETRLVRPGPLIGSNAQATELTLR